jgi:hypothetical protein
MDWTRAIEINQTALARIVAGLIAMVGVVSGGRLPQPVYRAVSLVLRPAEAAVRRLIVIAARGLVVKLSPARPMPKGLAFAGAGSGRVSFPLFDPRKRFSLGRRGKAAKLSPRIHFFDTSPLVLLFQPRPVEIATPEPDDTVDAQRLLRRLEAVRMALDTLPRKAKRLARWKARCATKQSPPLRQPLRPGPPPGHRKEPRDDVDWVLKECHALARDALKEDTS